MAKSQQTWDETGADKLSHYPLREIAQRVARLKYRRTLDSKDDYKAVGKVSVLFHRHHLVAVEGDIEDVGRGSVDPIFQFSAIARFAHLTVRRALG